MPEQATPADLDEEPTLCPDGQTCSQQCGTSATDRCQRLTDLHRVDLTAGRTARSLDKLRLMLRERDWRPSVLRDGYDEYRHPDSPGEVLKMPTETWRDDYDAVLARLAPMQDVSVPADVDPASYYAGYLAGHADGTAGLPLTQRLGTIDLTAE